MDIFLYILNAPIVKKKMFVLEVNMCQYKGHND